MAKDILVDTNSGDFLFQDRDRKTQYWDVVWGRLFDGDAQLYMNVVVPVRKAGSVRYDDGGEYVCNVHAGYYADTSYFSVRLVTRDVATGSYVDLQRYDAAAPSPSEAMYYPEFVGTPQPIRASQLLLVDQDGYLKVVFKRYNKGSFVRAIICQGSDVDFKVGDGDSQSAQLLARCAPGKFYRFPTSGVDLTKYINSVVEHTGLTDSLVSEFGKDYKNVSEAAFDNTDGDLEVVFSGANEADDEGLSDPGTLDVELFRVADDDYVRSLYKAAQGVLMDNEGFVGDIEGWAGNLMGVWDVGGECGLDKTDYVQVVGAPKSRITGAGERVGDSGAGYLISSVSCTAGRLYALNYVGNVPVENSYSIIDKTNGTRVTYWRWDPMFVAETSDDKYVDEEFYTNDWGVSNRRSTSKNRRCFVPLQDCVVYYYAGSLDNDLNLKGFGVRPVADEDGNYSTILAIAVHPTTGKMYGIVSLDSAIEEVRLDLKSNRLFVIKQSS